MYIYIYIYIYIYSLLSAEGAGVEAVRVGVASEEWTIPSKKRI